MHVIYHFIMQFMRQKRKGEKIHLIRLVGGKKIKNEELRSHRSKKIISAFKPK